jgi:mycothiol synthase
MDHIYKDNIARGDFATLQPLRDSRRINIMLAQFETNSVRTIHFQLRQVTQDDLLAVVELLNACAIDQTSTPDTNANLILSNWTGPAFDLADSVRVAEAVDGRIVGYIEVWDNEPMPVTIWVWGRVHPDFEGLGIGTDLMDWAEDRLQQTLVRVPNELRVVYHSEGLKTHAPTRQFLEGRDMKLVRYFWRMIITLEEAHPQPVWPTGITIQTLQDINDLRTLYRAFDDAFQDHWGYVKQPEDEMISEWEHWISSDEEFDPARWYLAMDGKEIAGVCLCRRREWADPDMGWINILGVRRPWRRKGLGLAMLHFAFREFHRRGKLRAGLGVDAGSLTGATRLYEKAGMHVAREFYTYEKELRPGRDISKQILQ